MSNHVAILICQVLIAFGIYNVWILRLNKPSAWRGGLATTMAEEFAVYGLPKWMVVLVGFLKLRRIYCTDVSESGITVWLVFTMVSSRLKKRERTMKLSPILFAWLFWVSVMVWDDMDSEGKYG
jgi:hypothetical protein